MTAGPNWVDPPVVDLHPHQPTMVFPALPAPPAEVTDGVTALRVACAKWAPHLGASDHQAEVQACNVVLGRDQQFPIGVNLGVFGTLTVVGFIQASRCVIRFRSATKIQDVVVHVAIVFLGALAGVAAGIALMLQFGDGWSSAKDQMVFAACGLVATAGLAGLRWLRQVNDWRAAA